MSWGVILNVEIREGLANKKQAMFEERPDGGVGERHMAGGGEGNGGEGGSRQREK